MNLLYLDEDEQKQLLLTLMKYCCYNHDCDECDVCDLCTKICGLSNPHETYREFMEE